MSEQHCTRERHGNYTKGKESGEKTKGYCWQCLAFFGYHHDKDINKQQKKYHKKHYGIDYH